MDIGIRSGTSGTIRMLPHQVVIHFGITSSMGLAKAAPRARSSMHSVIGS